MIAVDTIWILWGIICGMWTGFLVGVAGYSGDQPVGFLQCVMNE